MKCKAHPDLYRHAAIPELDIEETVKWDPNLPNLDIEASAKTLNRIQETLQACEPKVQKMYAQMIQGWVNAGGKIECVRPGRIYLKLKTSEHEYGKYGKLSHKFNIAVLAAPKGKRGPTIDVAWNLARGDYAYLEYVPQQVNQYEGVVSELPGFGQEGAVTRLAIDDAFTDEHVSKFLEAMVDLKQAAGKN